MCDNSDNSRNLNLSNCGKAALSVITIVFGLILILFLGIIITGIIINNNTNPPSQIFSFVSENARVVWFVIGCAVFLIVTIMTFFLLRFYFVAMIKKMLCPIFCPIASTIREIALFITDAMQQIDTFINGMDTFSTNLNKLFSELGNVPITDDINRTLHRLSEAIPGGLNPLGYVPKTIQGDITAVKKNVQTLSVNFTHNLASVISNLTTLKAPLLAIRTGLNGVNSVLLTVASILENFCCCCNTKGLQPKYTKDEKKILSKE
jgi:hypothetical protein